MTRAMISLLDYRIAVAPVELTGQSLDLFAHCSASIVYAIV
jgi:hypothetical protein